MRAGELNQRIDIQKPNLAQDETSGEMVASWGALATVWARVRPMGGAERFEANRENAERTLLFRIRHRTDIDEQMRIVHDSDNYDIERIDEIGQNEGLDIVATARVP